MFRGKVLGLSDTLNDVGVKKGDVLTVIKKTKQKNDEENSGNKCNSLLFHYLTAINMFRDKKPRKKRIH